MFECAAPCLLFYYQRHLLLYLTKLDIQAVAFPLSGLKVSLSEVVNTKVICFSKHQLICSHSMTAVVNIFIAKGITDRF